MKRRMFLHLAAGAAALPTISRSAFALDYPTRPVHLIVGYAPAGGTDIFTRLLGQALSERLRQSFIVDNRPGAASNLATELVVRAPADGYTLITTDAAAAINATLYDKLNFNFVRDIAVVGMTRAPLVMEVHPSVPATTVPEFISYAKANPGKIAMASAGIGSPPHLAGELFKVMTRTNLTHVPYRGSGPATTDLLGGQVQVLFNGVAPAIEHVHSGRIRALAVTTSTRLGVLPDVPTVAEFVPGYEASQWYAAGVRRETAAEIIDRLNNEINAGLAAPSMKARLTEIGNTAFPGSAADFNNFVAAETEKWGKVIRSAGIKAE